MGKMTDSRAVDVLGEMREGDVLIDEADYVAAIDQARGKGVADEA